MKVVKKEPVNTDHIQTERHGLEQAANRPCLVGLHSCSHTESRLVFVLICVHGALTFHMLPGDICQVLHCSNQFSIQLSS